jgi:hypothetical protein
VGRPRATAVDVEDVAVCGGGDGGTEGGGWVVEGVVFGGGAGVVFRKGGHFGGWDGGFGG